MIIGTNDKYTAPHNYHITRYPLRLGGVLTYTDSALYVSVLWMWIDPFVPVYINMFL
jgi:hypothetical protein